MFVMFYCGSVLNLVSTSGQNSSLSSKAVLRGVGVSEENDEEESAYDCSENVTIHMYYDCIYYRRVSGNHCMVGVMTMWWKRAFSNLPVLMLG